MTLIVPKGGLIDASPLSSRPRLAALPVGLIQELLQLSNFDQLLQVTPQRPAIFSSMPPLLVVLAVETLVAPHEVSSHLIWPLKVWLILNFL